MWTKQNTKNGDTLVTLAKEYNTTIEKILLANGVMPPSKHTDKYLSVKAAEYAIPVNISRKHLSKLVLECDIQNWVRGIGGDCAMLKMGASKEANKLLSCVPGQYCRFTKDTQVVLPLRARKLAGLGSVVDLYNMLLALPPAAKAFADAVVAASASASAVAWRESFLSTLKSSLDRAMQKEAGLYKFEKNSTLLDNITKNVKDRVKDSERSFASVQQYDKVLTTKGNLLVLINNIRQESGVSGVTKTPNDALSDVRAGKAKLKRGSKGAPVEQLQAKLKELLPASAIPSGYKVDGDFGGRTETAVKAYQKANKLPANGIVDAPFVALLDRSTVVEKVPSGKGGKSKEKLRATTATLADVRAGKATFARGQEGPGVAEAQAFILTRVVAELEVDGKFGPDTEAVVKAAQNAASVAATGKIDQATVAAWDKMPDLTAPREVGSNTMLYVGLGVGAALLLLLAGGATATRRSRALAAV